ncbi:hypothetical protein CEXT_343281 [Caerostris extrusa]|uniref:Uncharacterized protein n=1 Tax=Caerostris extrusa TaxID=172846 RepID=A0AAV4VIF5_CAEEX|nr:hypothetical protein CEXT_343281 [Caerostris extrusa]
MQLHYRSPFLTAVSSEDRPEKCPFCLRLPLKWTLEAPYVEATAFRNFVPSRIQNFEQPTKPQLQLRRIWMR